jgi:hypothetical protein
MLQIHTETMIEAHSKTKQNPTTTRQNHYLTPELYGEADGLHGVGVAPDKEAAKEDTLEVVPLGMHVRQLANVVCHHPTEAHGHVCHTGI